MSPPEPRILMTADAVGGVWTFATTLARALAALGYEVTLLTLGPAPRPQQLAALKDVRGLSVEITDLALEWMDPAGDDIARARQELAAVVRRVRPDLIHHNGYREALHPFGVPSVVVAHSCVGSWWEACRSPRRMDAKWRRYLARVGAALDAADAWVAPTRAYRDWIARCYAPARPGDVIRNGVAPMRAGARKEPVVLAAGRVWDEAKNLAALARIAPSLPWPVRIAGTLQDRDGGRARIEGVERLGQLPHPQLIAEMRRAAIFASPARYEPFGLGVLEAAANGCALVLSDIASFNELWRDAALFADPRDEDTFAAAVRLVCRDDRLRGGLQRKADRRARRYSLDATVNGYCGLYDRLTLTPQPRPAPEPVYAEARE